MSSNVLTFLLRVVNNTDYTDRTRELVVNNTNNTDRTRELVVNNSNYIDRT